MSIPRLDAKCSALLVVDIQERLLPAMADPKQLLARAGCLIEGFVALGLPIMVTEQYPAGLGITVEPIAKHLPQDADRFEKMAFSACTEGVLAALGRRNIHSVVVAGIEAHVCVLQTCLDLAGAGYVTAVAVDAVTSRRQIDRDAAVERMLQSGVLSCTAESALMELLGQAGGDCFRSILKVIK